MKPVAKGGPARGAGVAEIGGPRVRGLFTDLDDEIDKLARENALLHSVPAELIM